LKEFLGNWQHFSFSKRATVFLYISFLSKTFAEIPPPPPFEKGGRRGDLGWPFQKTKFILTVMFAITCPTPSITKEFQTILYVAEYLHSCTWVSKKSRRG
jgi:hypothetical protein